MIFYYGLTDNDGKFTWMNLAKITTPENIKALGLALLLAFVSTVICLILAYPLAMILAGRNVNQSSFVVLVFILPMWMNFLLRTIAWMSLLEDQGLINSMLRALGIGGVKLMYNDGAVLLGMVYNFIPFMILQINTSLCKMDHSLLEASADLGANKVQTFLRVTFPLSLSGVISGIALVFLPAVSSFFIPKLLGGGQFFLIGNVIENQFITVGEWNFGSAISMIMAVIMMLCMYLIRRVDEHNSGGRKKKA